MKLLRRYNFLETLGLLFTVLLFVNAVGVMATTISDAPSTFTGDVVFEFPSVTHRVNRSGFFDNNTLLGAGALSTATQPLNSKGNSFATVQGALDDLAGDGWVYVPQGIFSENVTISDDNVILFGAGWSSVIDGSTTGSAVNITGDRNTVRDLQLRTLPGGGNAFEDIVVTGANNHIDNVFGNGSDSFGFNINPGSAVVNWVTNSYIFDADTVGLLSQGSTIMMGNRIVQSGTHGIQLGSSGDNSVGANNIIDTAGDDGINIGASAENNTFTGNFIAGWTNEAIDDDSGTSVVIGNSDGLNQLRDDLNMGGNDIPNVGTITSTKSTSGAHDPPFKAPDGVTYTSYGMVSTIYQVRSSVMQGQLDGGEFLLDFSVVSPGSELYRFYWEIDPDTLRVMTTSLEDCIVSYGMPTLTTIMFYSTSWCNDQDAKFNFELSANRFDWKEWPSQYDEFGDEEPSWLQDVSEYVLGENTNESMRGIWKPDHPTRVVKEEIVLEGS